MVKGASCFASASPVESFGIPEENDEKHNHCGKYKNHRLTSYPVNMFSISAFNPAYKLREAQK
jgi:hypothetical protein